MRTLTCVDLSEVLPKESHCLRCCYTGAGSEDAECSSFPQEIEVEGVGRVEIATCCGFSISDLLDATPTERATLLRPILG